MTKNYSYSKYHPNVNPNHPGFQTRPPHDVFPEDIECVLEPQNGKGGIYIGNLEAAQSLQTLKRHRIQSILTACKNIHIRHPKEHVPYTLYIPGEDHQNYDLSVHFDTAINFIHQSRKQTNILVHCMAGISRSVTLVLAYLIKHRGMSFNQAFSLIQQRRNKINPNAGFIRQLQKWEQKHSVQPSRVRFSSEHRNYEKPESNYLQKSRPQSYKDAENNQPYDYSYKLGNYTKYTPNLEGSHVRNYNPEYDYKNINQNESYKSRYYQSNAKNSYETIVRPNNPLNSISNNPKSSVKQNNKYYDSMYKPTQAQSNISRNRSIEIPRDRNIQTLSKDLDQRIAKIKQKYYETSNNSQYDTRKIDQSDYNTKWIINKTRQQPRLNNYMAQNISRSRVDKQSLRNSIYTPYAANRSFTYQYS